MAEYSFANGSALFIVPYIQLVFGLECTFRSLRKMPFQARGKYDVTICGGVIILMLVATWIPSHIFKEPDVCFASLVWFITRYGKLGFIMLSTITVLLIISALIIFIRLSTVNMIDQHQRIAASRMVYYLVLGIVSMVSIFRPSSLLVMLILLGFCYSILCIFACGGWRPQGGNDGNGSFEPVGFDEWAPAAFPSIEHRHHFLRTQGWKIVGQKEA